MTIHLSRLQKRLITLAIWVAGIIIFLNFSFWNYAVGKKDSENRLAREAGHTASQLARLISLPDIEMDHLSASSLVDLAMEDDRIYAVKVDGNGGIMEGQRRNYLWEPIPWDDEIAINCIQGMNPINYRDKIVGKVEVWLSPRLYDEEDAILAKREIWRFAITALIWTAAFLFFLWQSGELRRLIRYLGTDSQQDAKNDGATEKTLGPAAERVQSDTPPVIDPALGRMHQKQDTDAWLVTAGMFRQTFARGPALISRLYAEGQTAGLCHLGRILEQAAPCIGALRLTNAAKEMQNALNNPDSGARALPVEECARALEEVLEALCGNGQWRSDPGETRS